jgi:hypothetical protein
MTYFRASFLADQSTKVYSHPWITGYDRQGDASAVVRSLTIEGREVIVSEGGYGSFGQDYYLSFDAEDKKAARAFLDRTRITICSMMQAEAGILIPYEDNR